MFKIVAFKRQKRKRENTPASLFEAQGIPPFTFLFSCQSPFTCTAVRDAIAKNLAYPHLFFYFRVKVSLHALQLDAIAKNLDRSRFTMKLSK
jgi:hypothetical protein